MTYNSGSMLAGLCLRVSPVVRLGGFVFGSSVDVNCFAILFSL